MTGSPLSWPALRERLISIDETNSTLAPDALTAVALLYIALPNLIFLGGWLKLPYAIVAIMLVATSLVQFLRSPQLCWRQSYTRGALLLITATALVWCSLGGAGHFFHVNPDWHVRDTVLGDLTFSAWPPSYSITNGYHHILRSAIAYFLPAAVVGKLAGIASVDVALYVWTAFGTALFLSLLPLPRSFGWRLMLQLLLVIFFSGMDFLGIVLVTGDLPIFPLRLEWWVPFSYTSLTGQLLWAPNHTLALWLTTGLFYRHWGHQKFPVLVTILLPLLVIWTPFAIAGILPFIGIALLRWFSTGKSIRDWGLTTTQICMALAITYFTMRLMTLDIQTIPSAPTIAVAPSKDRFVLKYLVFVLMEFAVLGLLIARSARHSFGLLWLAMALLMLLPLYQYGPSNDTMLRLSTPCLLVLLIMTMHQTGDWMGAKRLAAIPAAAPAIIVVLLIGACTPFNELWRAATFRHRPGNYGVSLVEVHNGYEPPHYVGILDRADLLLLLRQPALVPASEERIAQGLLPGPAKPR